MPGENIKCIESPCARDATYVSPEYWCDHHWSCWWADGMADRFTETKLWMECYGEALTISLDTHQGEDNGREKLG